MQKLSERKPVPLHYIGTSFGITNTELLQKIVLTDEIIKKMTDQFAIILKNHDKCKDTYKYFNFNHVMGKLLILNNLVNEEYCYKTRLFRISKQYYDDKLWEIIKCDD